MDNEQAFLHVAQPLFLWALPFLILCWVLKQRLNRGPGSIGAWHSLVDPHLIPYLTKTNTADTRRYAHIFSAYNRIVALIICGCILIALAGPRYDFRDAKRPSTRPILAVILDISQSMDADDTPPSRITRARQEIQDIITHIDHVDLALIAFAADAQIIVPPTSDTHIIADILPDLDTDIPAIQGSSFESVVKKLLAIKKNSAHAGALQALMLTDGGFNDTQEIPRLSNALQAQSIPLHILAIGHDSNADIFDKRRRQRLPAAFSENTLRKLAARNEGIYIHADYSGNDTDALKRAITSAVPAHDSANDTTRIWEEYFYLAIIPALFLLYPLFFRRIAALFVMMFPAIFLCSYAEAADIKRLFLNDAQRGALLLEQESFNEAEHTFNSPYRKGIAAYRAGKFREAEQYFTESRQADPANADASYNLGNALARQGKFDEAISAYEDTLKTRPDHANAAHNADIARYMLSREQQKEQSSQNADQTPNNASDQSKSNNNSMSSSDTSPDADNNEEATSDSTSHESTQTDNVSDEEQASASDDASDADPVSNNDIPSEKRGDKMNGDNATAGLPEELPKEGAQSDDNTNDDLEDNGNDASDTPENSRRRERTERDINADLWLNRMKSDNRAFLRNRFYIESLEQNTQQGTQPW